MSAEGSGLGFLSEELAALDRESLRRRPPEDDVVGAPGSIVMCSNDYLGLARTPLEPEAAGLDGGSGASALVSGYQPEHLAAERALSAWLAAPATLLFSSGYAANLSVIAALAGTGDVVLSDRLNHASIVDGCRLSRASVQVFAHCDAEDLARRLRATRREFRRCFIVTESYFSMDGDGPDLARYQELALEHDAALLVDEAHALGIFGPAGRGRCAELGFSPSVLIGTFGKAFGLQGAMVAGSVALREFLWNRARAFVFSTAGSPALAATIPARLRRVAAADARRARCLGFAERIRSTLHGLGADVRGVGPIIPWVVGSAELALELQRELAKRGVMVTAIRPPTVPASSSRLRITACAGLSDDQELRALEALAQVARERQLPRAG